MVGHAPAPFEPSPHWGKWFRMDNDQIRSMYPRLDDFVSLSKRLDPNQKFRNSYLERVLALPNDQPHEAARNETRGSRNPTKGRDNEVLVHHQLEQSSSRLLVPLLAVIALALASPLSAAAATTPTDDFERAGGALGSSWTSDRGTWSIASGAALASSAPSNAVATSGGQYILRWETLAGNADQPRSNYPTGGSTLQVILLD